MELHCRSKFQHSVWTLLLHVEVSNLYHINEKITWAVLPLIVSYRIEANQYNRSCEQQRTMNSPRWSLCLKHVVRSEWSRYPLEPTWHKVLQQTVAGERHCLISFMTIQKMWQIRIVARNNQLKKRYLKRMAVYNPCSRWSYKLKLNKIDLELI